MEDLIKGELDWHNKVNENFHEVDSQMAESVNKINHYGIDPCSQPFNVPTDGISDCYQSIINMLSNLTGGRIIFPHDKTFTISHTIEIDPADFNNTLTIDLNGANFNFTGSGPLFKLLSNGWPSSSDGGWLIDKTKINIIGNGARLIGNPNATHCVQAIDCIDYTIKDFNTLNFPGFSVQIYLSVLTGSRWCEENKVENIWCRGGGKGVISTFENKGDDDGSGLVGESASSISMNHTIMRNLRFNGTIDNAIGFDLNGNHSRSIIESCGGWINQNGSINGHMFRLNGWFEQGLMIAPWIDQGNSKDSSIVFGDGYPQDPTNSKRNQITITNVTPTYFALPDNIHYKANIITINSDYGKYMCFDEISGAQEFYMNSDAFIKHIIGGKNIINSNGDSIVTFTRNFPNFNLQKILSINISPFIDTQDINIIKIVANCGIATINKNANGAIISVTFFVHFTGNGTANFLYDIIGLLPY